MRRGFLLRTSDVAPLASARLHSSNGTSELAGVALSLHSWRIAVLLDKCSVLCCCRAQDGQQLLYEIVPMKNESNFFSRSEQLAMCTVCTSTDQLDEADFGDGLEWATVLGPNSRPRCRRCHVTSPQYILFYCLACGGIYCAGCKHRHSPCFPPNSYLI